MDDLSRRLAELSPQRRELLERALQQRGDAFNTFPVSFAQQRLWFLDQWTPGHPIYHLPGALHLSGPLDVAALQHSLQVIVGRHEALRTTFVPVDGQPVQHIHPRLLLPLPVVDLEHLPTATQAAQIPFLARQAARQPFDLAQGPLLRASLLRLGSTEHVLLLTLHHIVADGWSLGVFLRELAALYAARVSGQPAPFPALPIQYADFARWQRQWLRGAARESQLIYWRRQLAGAPPVLELPADYPRPPLPTFRGARQAVMLPRTLTDALTALSRRAKCTLFMTLLAAFQTVLYRYTGQTDLVVGAPVAGRSRAETEPLIGCFVNTLVLRADLSGNPPFREVLRRVREVALGAYAHQDLPFEQLVEALQPERDPRQPPLVQVMLALQPAPLPVLEAAGVTLRPLEVESGTAKFDLTLDLAETPEGLHGWLEYATDLFAPATIARLAGHLAMLLDGIAADPERRLAALPLLTHAERQQLLIDWTATTADYPRERRVQQLFEAQVTRTPDAVALVFDQPTTNDQRPTTSASPLHPFTPSPLHPFTQQLTYRELDRRANQLAHYLHTLGVGPEVRVGICVARSLEMIIGILGILKAGGAYVPLDPAYPPERLAFILADTQAPVVLTQRQLLARLPNLTTDHRPPTTDHRPPTTDHPAHPVTLSPPHLVTPSPLVVCLDADWKTIGRRSAENPASAAHGENISYIIYTSGSTGWPKGVMVHNRGMVNLCYGLRMFFDDPRVSDTALITSISFDISVNQIFPTLCFGRTLHIIADELKYDSRAMLRYVADHGIHLLDAVPSYLHALLTDLQARPITTCLQYLLIGGEKLERRLVQQIFDQLGDAVVIVNIYGLTESTDINLFATIAAGDGDQPITVGRPLQNNRVYILSPHGSVQPVGVVGELCIAGESLSRGYLNQPGLTAEKFIPNPFSGDKETRRQETRRQETADGRQETGDRTQNSKLKTQNSRLCRTGDVGRWRPDGTIELFGRLDHQVKIHGFRIEVGEIETALEQHAAVREAVVVARADGPGERRLVAYIVSRIEDRGLKIEDSHPGTSETLSSILYPLSSELRRFLQTKLPSSMVPSAFVLLEALPHTPNGKVDRTALPAPSRAYPDQTAGFVAPRTPVEAQLAVIWADVLGLERVGVHDNFFDLGGHSLRATQLIARLRAACRVELPLRTLFAAPTIARLAAQIAPEREIARALPPIERVARGPALPLSFAQQRLWFLDRLSPGSANYNISGAVWLAGWLDVPALARSLNTIVRRHEALRTTFTTMDGLPAQVIGPPVPLALAVVDLCAMPAPMREAAALRLTRVEARQPFDLARGPLVRVVLLRLGAADHALLLTLHHIVSDGWSLGVLIRDLAALYPGYSAGAPVALPDLPIQYADFAVWQRAWLQGAVLAAQLAYWKRQLRNLPTLQLPGDRPRPPVQTFQGALRSSVLPMSLATALNALSRRAEATLFMTLLAAFQLLLARYAGQDDIVVGSPIAGRTHNETEGLIGFFVNTLVLRSDLSGNPTMWEALGRVREVTLDAYAHQDLPFEQLVEELRPTRDLSRHPLFQVFFVLQNAPMPALDLAGLALRPVEVDLGMAKFDLTLALVEEQRGLVVTVEYNTDLFEAATIARLLGHLETLLHGIAGDLGLRLADVPLLTDAERHELLVTWSTSQTGDLPDLCVHELIAAQAARTPDAVAVVFDGPQPGVRGQGGKETRRQGDKETRSASVLSPQSSVLSPQSLTYRELNARANQLAHYLRRLGVGPEVPVGVCLESSAALVIGLLGILKAGGAYVPLDPAYPQERLDFMLADARVAVLLTTTDHRRPTTDGEPRTKNQEPRTAGFQITQNSKLKTQNYPHPFTPSPLHPFTPSRPVVDLIADWPMIAAASEDAPASDVTPDNLAYVIYTSGSTGRPKGVLITQRAIADHCHTVLRHYEIDARDRVLQFAPLNFDTCLEQLLPTLVAGARVVLRGRDVWTVAEMYRRIAAFDLTVVNFTPAYWHQLVEAVARTAEPLAHTSLRLAVVGGDVMLPESVARWRRTPLRSVRLLNGYGPTETTITATTFALSGRPGPLPLRIPIGRPLEGRRCYVLDRWGQLLPTGVAGELYLGGLGLARGYLGRPDLTAAAFVPNPFAEDKETRRQGDKESGDATSNTQHPTPNTRLYKTGDLVRRLPDGMIEFLGRIDQQVKVRGFRIELGEIEVTLGEHAAVRECVVAAHEAGPSEKRLVAYIVPTTEDRGLKIEDSNVEAPETLSSIFYPLSSDLRGFLKERLPDYMVPGAFVLLEALPRTPNGKVDRRALPAPGQSRPGPEETFVAPRDPGEELLAEIWADLLGRERVGVHDNFFDLGGHSLLATQLISRVYTTFQVDLPLRSLFEAPTVAGLAARIEAAQSVARGVRAPSIPRVAWDGVLPLSYAQQRLWLLDQLEPGSSAYTIPSAVRLSGPLDVPAVERSLNEIVRRHAALRTTFVAVEGRPVQVIAPPGTRRSRAARALLVVDLQGLPAPAREAAARRLADDAVRLPFDLARGPLLRIALLRLDARAHVLLLTLHHIVADGWSLGIFVRELAALYAACAAGQPASLPPLPIQYADFAVWQRTWLQGSGVGRQGDKETRRQGDTARGQGSGVRGQGDTQTRRHADTQIRLSAEARPPTPNTQHPTPMQAQLAYWRTQLAGAPPVLDLPTDWPRLPARAFKGARRALVLPEDLSARLRALSRQQEVTLFMALLAAFKILLHRYTGQDQIVVGTPIAGRTRTEIEGLIGFFLNTLVLRTDLSGAPTFCDLLAQVRAVCLGAYAHQDLPFERLLEELQPERDLSYTPLFQVFFNMLNLPDSRIELPELTIESLTPPDIGAKFDITLYAQERGDEIVLDLVYNAGLFEAERMVELLEQLRHLLSQIVANPQERITHFSLITPTGRGRLPDPLEALDPSWEGSVHTAFSRQARRVPERPAVIDPGEVWTYAELDARSNQLANYLVAQGVRPQDVIAIYGHRSAALVWALLGVLKAGAAFTILDPAYPAARLVEYLHISQARGWIQIEAAGTLPEPLERFTAAVALRCRLALPRRAAVAAPGLLVDYATDDPGVVIGPDDLACITFTSGSIGAPKGILGRHGPLTHFLPWQCRTFDLRETDRFSMLSGLAHDPLQRDIFTPLWLGATLCIPDGDAIFVPGRLAGWMQHEAISVAHLTPALGQLLTEARHAASIEILTLRYAFIVGDVLTRRDVARIRALAPAATCVNFYGSTETQRAVGYYIVPNDDALVHNHDRDLAYRKEILPLGRGMPDVQLLVLNSAGQLAGIGELGEIYVRSPHLARGYLGDEALTRERFIPDPFAGVSGVGCWVLEDSAPNTQHPTPNTRLYRTGDLGRYMPDGNVAFCGRADQQVKIRGFRVEPGEIEAALLRHPAVRASVVIAREDTPGEVRLVAYIVPTTEDRGLKIEDSNVEAPETLSSIFYPLSSDLRGFLKERLPDYMVPSALVVLEALPLTPNGKVDRRALPAPTVARAAGGFVAPRTPDEAALADIWAAMFDLERVGVHDNFFALGGHSLLAAQLVAQVRDRFEVELSLRALFEAPTVAGMASAIAGRAANQAGYAVSGARLPMIVPAPDQKHRPFPLTDIQQAYWIGRSGAFELGNVATHSYRELEIAALDLEWFGGALRRLIERHDMLRAIVLPSGQQQILAQVPPYQIAVIDLRGQAPQLIESQLAAVRERMSHQILPSDQWPLFEIRASRLDEQLTRLHISLDLLIGDAWSWQLLLHELIQLYQNPAAPLAPLELSFRDYVLTEIALRDSELYQRSRDYWWGRLSTLPPAPELPLAKSPALLTQPRFIRREARLEPEPWRRLKNAVARAGLTPSGALLAAFAEVLAVWSKRPRFTINVTLFNRLPLHPQVHEIMGDFTSLTLLAVDHSAPGSFAARAWRLQEQLWADLDQRYVGGVRVLRELARTHGAVGAAAMPVVFTSTLNLRAPAHDTSTAIGLGDMVYSVSQTPQVWLDHQVTEHAGALVFNWDAVEDLFPEGLLQDMFDAYCRLLRRLIDEPASWAEQARQLVPSAQLARRASVNATEAPIPAALLHTLFAAHVPQRPEQAAVVAGDRTLTYAELDRCANQVGRRLRQLGARPNTLVAVVMEKGWEQVVAVLGILRAGAAYLPIDPALPKERLCSLFEQGEVTLALTLSWLEAELAWPDHIQRLCMDSAELAGTDDRPLEPLQSAQDLAYVIYTSGSTGTPKGVMIDHRGAVNTILDINRRFGVGPADRVLALSALSFDLSVYDIFGTLAAGGTIVLPAAWAARDPIHWVELIARERITIWNSVPALLEMLVEYSAGRGEALSGSLRLALLSGDWIPLTLPDQIKALVDGVAVVSLGGATEASIWSILYPIEAADPTWKSIPYGCPMTNQQFHVLDEALEPCPVWVPGQLYIAGMGLARGYFNRPDLTAERFIPNPFAEVTGDGCWVLGAESPNTQHPTPNTRLYKTGDLGRYLPDGTIEFLGRADFQVKIQGQRVELGEIEAALAQHPAVRQTVVAALGEPRGNKRLVAYIVPDRLWAGATRSEDEQAPEHGTPADSNGNAAAGSREDGQPIRLDLLAFKLQQPSLRQEHGPSVQLVRPELDEALTHAYTARRSYRTFLQQSLPLEQFSGLLSCLLQIELDGFALPKYRYASAGSLYPVQTYVYIKPGRVEGLAGGTYYYHPKDHCLVSLSAGIQLDRNIHAPVNRSIFDESAFSLFLVGHLDAIAPVYGELARDFCMLEAGYMSQLLMTAAHTHQIGLCPVGTLDGERIRDWFALENSHVLLHSLLGGPIDPAARARAEDSLAASSARSATQQSNSDSALDAALRRFLQEKLPSFMVPTAFVVLDALPLTSNGKVDRRALPEPDGLQSKQTAYHEPQTNLERAIAAVWQEVLQVDRVGLDDNFFAIGGNSVQIVQVHTRLRKAIDREIPIIELFRSPTVGSLAQWLSQDQDQGEQPFFQDVNDQIRRQKEAANRQKRRLKSRSRTNE